MNTWQTAKLSCDRDSELLLVNAKLSAKVKFWTLKLVNAIQFCLKKKHMKKGRRIIIFTSEFVK